MIFGQLRHTVFLFLLSFAITIYASEKVVIVPLTDPRITLGGNAHYNASLCGGAISLPNLGDSLSFPFNGSDIQLDFVVIPKEDYGNFTVSPDDAYVYSGNSTPWEEPQSLNCSFRESTSFSSGGNYQLPVRLHNFSLTTVSDSAGGGGLVVVGISYFPDPLPSTFSTWTPDAPGPHGSRSSNRVILPAALASVTGVFLILCLGEILRRRWRKRKQAKNPSDSSMELTNLGPGEATPNTQKPSKSSRRFNRFVESLFWAS